MTPKEFITRKLPVMAADFIIGGFIGWIYETVLTSIVWGQYAERGVLPIPILPIYGFFAVILPFFFKKEHNIFLIFIISTAGATIFELIGAYLTEALLHERLWSYTAWKFNYFDGRISLFSSLIFGAMSVLFVKCIHPLTEKLILKIPAHK